MDEHRPFQEKSWRAERVAWVAFATILVLALLGFTGADGPAARASVASASAVIDYPRIARWDAPDTIAVTLAPAAGRRDIAIAAAFAREFEVEQVFPQPVSSLSRQGGVVLSYDTTENGPMTVTLFVRPRSPGMVKFDLAVDGGKPVTLRTFVLP